MNLLTIAYCEQLPNCEYGCVVSMDKILMGLLVTQLRAIKITATLDF